MERPLNIHPDIWKLRNSNNIKKNDDTIKQIQLDDYTKLNNSIDMFVQAIQIFKGTYQKLDVENYSQKQKEGLFEINKIIDCALIPYTIDIVKRFNQINIQEIEK